MTLVKSLLLVTATLALAGVARADEDYYARYSALAPGDSTQTYGRLKLEVDNDDEPDTVDFEVGLYNAINVTGIHLHLQGNSSNGLFGGPLFLALTNTTQSPVSSSSHEPLVQKGHKTSQDLVNNPQFQQVVARLDVLGLDLASLGINLRQSIRVVDLQKLIDVGVIYTDVHTVTRVSPQGLTRGPVRAEDYDNDDGVTASASSQASASASSGDDASEGDEGDEGDDDAYVQASASSAASASTSGRKLLA